MEAKPPRDGDIVRQRGCTTGRKMLVESEALGEEHNWEGVRNGVYCTWTENGEERFEVYRPEQLVVIKPASNSAKISI